MQVLLYLIVALGVGAAAGYFFYENLEEWSDPSSHYRTGDEDCSWLKPYPYHDKHDSYHILSAYAFFFLFMVSETHGKLYLEYLSLVIVVDA